MSSFTIGKNTRKDLQTLLERKVVPTMLIIDAEASFGPRRLGMLCRALVFTSEIKHLSGEVSRRTWEGIANVVLTVAKHRRHPLTVGLRAIDFTMSKEEARHYVDVVRRNTPDRVVARWGAACI